MPHFSEFMGHHTTFFGSGVKVKNDIKVRGQSAFYSNIYLREIER